MRRSPCGPPNERRELTVELRFFIFQCIGAVACPARRSAPTLPSGESAGGGDLRERKSPRARRADTTRPDCLQIRNRGDLRRVNTPCQWRSAGAEATLGGSFDVLERRGRVDGVCVPAPTAVTGDAESHHGWDPHEHQASVVRQDQPGALQPAP
jgi:hypothetical protein